MSDLMLTSHSQLRLQQRAIPRFVVELLMQFGSAFRAGGAERLIFDKSAINRLRRYLGGERGLKCIERWLRVYVVVSDDGHVITAGHKRRRFRR